MKKFLLSLLTVGVVCFEATAMEQDNSFLRFFKKNRSYTQVSTNTPQIPLIEDTIVPTGTTPEQMISAFQAAPPKLKAIVEFLKNRERVNRPEYNCHFITGHPGVGKTTVAKAIPFMAKWQCVFRTASELEGTGRNQASEKLLALLNAVITKNKNSVVIIDEINQLLENAESENHDTASTSKSLWTFLDKQHGNKKFFLIGTLNRMEKLPQQIKSRVLGQSTKMVMPKSESFITDLIMSEFNRSKVIVTFRLNGSALKTIQDTVKPKSIRDVQQFVNSCVMGALADAGPTDEVRVHQGHIYDAMREIEEMKKDMKYEEQIDTDEERRHKENIQMHERQFVQTHILQSVDMKQTIGLNLPFISSSTTIPNPTGTLILNSVLTEDQRKMYNEMKPSHT